MKRTITLPLVTFGLLAAACTAGSSDATPSTGTDGSVDSELPVTTADPTTTDVETVDPNGDEPAAPDETTSGSDGPFAFAPAALTQFDECASLLDYIHVEAAERIGPYGLDGGRYFGPDIAVAESEPVADEESPAAEPASAEPTATQELPQATDSGAATAPPVPSFDDDTAESGDGTFSTTNVQVDGVDEPDIIKTDGNRIVAIANETLYVFDVAADGSTGTARGSVRLSDLTGGGGDPSAGLVSYSYGHEIFFAGDRVVVFARGDVYVPYGPVDEPVLLDDVVVDAPTPLPAIDGSAAAGADAEAEFSREPAIEPVPGDPVEPEPIPTEPLPLPPRTYFGPQTVVFDVDLSNPDAPTIANSLTLEGNYVSARAIGTTARLVLTSPPQQLDFVYPSGPGSEQTATEANRDLVASTTIDDWLPSYAFSGGDGTASDSLVPCQNVHVPSNFSGFEMLSIVSIDLGGPLGPPTGTSTVMASGDTVYASQDRLYVSTNVWNPVLDEASREWMDENYETAIHRFSIAGDAPASYEGSGSVDGHLLNQFAMNDRDGTFFVATTTGAPWSDGTESQIVALELNGDRLDAVGSVGGLGAGERIFSVRYVGDAAYVVTFRQVDPFYVVDIADPRAMSVLGELKIPGYSSYLHPISDTLVLGVGQDATDQGRTTGTKVSLFDVSDRANPVEVDVWTLPDAYSDAEFDHRAFLYWPATSTAVLPLQSYADRYAGAVVLNISDDGIIEQGRISHVDDDDGPVGVTDCRVLTLDELGDTEDSEFFWISQEGGQVQGCASGQEGGATGLFCDVIPIDELQYWTERADEIDVTGFDRIEICWPNWDGYQFAIQRTLVIDSTLWTLSNTRLQANSLATLGPTAVLPIN